MAIAIPISPEDNSAVSRDTQLALVLQQLEQEEVQNLEKKEQMMMRYGDFLLWYNSKRRTKHIN